MGKMLSSSWGVLNKRCKFDYAAIDNPCAGRVICGHCGSDFCRKAWNFTKKPIFMKLLKH
jgi:hypothetical protein